MKAGGGGPTLRNPIRQGFSACCALATSGDATSAVDRTNRNSRRLIHAPESLTGIVAMLGRAQEGAEKRLARPLWVISEHVQRKQVRSAIVEAKETAGWRSLRNLVKRFA